MSLKIRFNHTTEIFSFCLNKAIFMWGWYFCPITLGSREKETFSGFYSVRKINCLLLNEKLSNVLDPHGFSKKKNTRDDLSFKKENLMLYQQKKNTGHSSEIKK